MTADTILDTVGTLTARHSDQRAIGLYLNILPVSGNRIETGFHFSHDEQRAQDNLPGMCVAELLAFFGDAKTVLEDY
jgi:hypothetical protein